MPKQHLEKLLVASAQSALALQRPDGGLVNNFNLLPIVTWSLCYARNFPGNPFYKSPRVLDAIVRMGDYHFSCLDARGQFVSNECSAGGWDEWRYYAWMEAMLNVQHDLDAARVERWTQRFVDSGKHLMAMCIDMDTFDGGIPNHGTWSHVYVHRIGQLFGVDEYRRVTRDAIDRIIASQTPDGCWREGQSAGGLQGTPVTHYNLTTAMAISLFHHHTGDSAAAASLDRAWQWFHDFLLPDISMPPALDARTGYHAGPRMPHAPGYFMRRPEALYCAIQQWNRYAHVLANRPPDEHWSINRLVAFDAMQYDHMPATLEPRKPAWPEYRRMTSEEACIRRRNGWAVVLSGLSNTQLSNVGNRLFMQERQDLVNLYHQKLGLLVGSSHSKMDPDLSTFVLFDTGRAHYLHDQAYLKSTPPRDSLLLRYGSNIACVSVDTSATNSLAVEFSLHGERGRSPKRSPGHALSAMGARGQLTLRIRPDATLALGERLWKLPLPAGEAIQLRIPAREPLNLGGWSLACDQPWNFRWPIFPIDPYTAEQPMEALGLAQVSLYPGIFSLGGAYETPARPTATFTLQVPE